MTTLIFRRLNAKTEAQAIQLAKQLCKPCNMRSYAGVRWTDEAGVEHRWRWGEIPGSTSSAQT
jgi:hypothetical protein